MVFIRRIGETINEKEEFIIHKNVIKSPHGINSHISLTSKNDCIEISVSYFQHHMKRVISVKKLHGMLLRNVMLDMSSLGSKMDISVDSRKWILSKTYVVSAESRVGPYRKGNLATLFLIVKRIYRCQGGSSFLN